MTREEALLERLQKLWSAATNSCGGAPSQLLQEIREIEKQLEELKTNGTVS